MWEWAHDGKIVNAFRGISRREALFIAITASASVLVSLLEAAYIIPLHIKETLATMKDTIWWMALGVIFISRNNLLSLRLHELNALFDDMRPIPLRLCVGIAAIFLCCFGILYSSDEILMPLLDAILRGARTPFLGGVWGVLKQEVHYRFFLYYSLNRMGGRSTAFFLSVFFFAFSHQADPFYPIATIPAGVLFTCVTVASGSLIPAIILHFIMNVLFFSVSIP